MCKSKERTHKHHIIPRYMGGTDVAENLVEITVTQHAMFHFCNYQLWNSEEDKIAWRVLSGQITMDEAKREAQSIGGKKGTSEQKKEAGKKGGKKCKENGTGIFKMTSEQRKNAGKKAGKKGGKKCKENGTGIFTLTTEQLSENGKIGGKKAGRKNKQNKTGICGLTTKQRSDNGRKGGKKGGIIGGRKTSSQKWKCTKTGYISTPGGLSNYQKARGIDTSNRIRIE